MKEWILKLGDDRQFIKLENVPVDGGRQLFTFRFIGCRADEGIASRTGHYHRAIRPVAAHARPLLATEERKEVTTEALVHEAVCNWVCATAHKAYPRKEIIW